MIIGVIGGSSCGAKARALAEEVGREIAGRGLPLICGGLGGVMEAACKGAKSAGGVTIGILPASRARDANPYVDYPIATGMGLARNIIIVHTASALIAVDGKYGTLSEIAYAAQLGVPLVGLLTWKIRVPMVHARTPKEAVDKAVSLAEKRYKNEQRGSA
jgi:uncharacterized protein (TIGR00725 family)